MDKNMKKRLLIFAAVIGGIIVVAIIFLLIMNLISGKSASYEKIEQIMKNAAVEYYKVQNQLLPQNEGEELTIDADTLAKAKYMKPLSELAKKNVICTGKVVIRKAGEGYHYTPLLECGEEYQTALFYQYLQKDIVTSGKGLYQYNNQYIFRGENIKNYVELDKRLWRIVKIKENHDIVLILDSIIQGQTASWDDRYNVNQEQSVGYNSYSISRIRDELKVLYNNPDLLTSKTKKLIVPESLCVGRRDMNTSQNDGSIECTEKLDDQLIGLLPVYDYINASLDEHCKTPRDEACQNYNYLANGTSWWTLTGSATDDYQVYLIGSGGTISLLRASANYYIRPTITITGNTILVKGKGTESSPYILKMS